jgi:hypothetical protein
MKRARLVVVIAAAPGAGLMRPNPMTSNGPLQTSPAIGDGSERHVRLARVVIKTLTSSLLIALVLVPGVRPLFEKGIGQIFERSGRAETVKA